MKTCVLAWAVLGGAAALSGSVLGQTFIYVNAVWLNSISDDGRTLAGYSMFDSTGSAVWRADTGLERIGTEPGFARSNRAYAVSGDGMIVSGNSPTGQRTDQLYRWSGPGTFQGLGNVPLADRVEPADMNRDGTAIVGTVSSQQGAVYAGFIWTPQRGMRTLGIGTFSQARAVTSDGRTVAGGRPSPSNRTEAFTWSEAGGVRVLENLLPDGESDAFDISGDGRHVVGYTTVSEFEAEACVWTDGTVRTLGVLPNFVGSKAVSVSDDGSIITGICGNIQGPVTDWCFVWTRDRGLESVSSYFAFHNVVLPDGVSIALSNEVKVSRDGRTFFGTARTSSPSVSGSFVVTIPSPATLPLIVLGLAGACRARPSRSVL
jgi:uncharacterized membrane protein